MGTAASATETGQVFLAVSACSANALASRPGTSASVSSSIRVRRKPPSTLSRCTRAVVRMRRGVSFARLSPADRAMEKQPAWAAPISSSGLVPAPSSKRERKE